MRLDAAHEGEHLFPARDAATPADPRWIDNSQARLNTPSARTLAIALLSQDILDWLHTALDHKAP